MLYVTIMYQLISKTIRMHNGIDDNKLFRSRINQLTDGENIIDTAKTGFLPSVELVDYYDDPLVQTILTPDGINLPELLTFFEPNIVVRHRNENYTSYDNSKRYIYPMKVCEKSDFTSRGYKFDDESAAGISKRLCPDINAANADHYIIKNLYSNQVERLNFAIEIFKCKNTTTRVCKDDVKIAALFEKLMMNQQVLDGAINYHSFNDKYE